MRGVELIDSFGRSWRGRSRRDSYLSEDLGPVGPNTSIPLSTRPSSQKAQTAGPTQSAPSFTKKYRNFSYPNPPASEQTVSRLPSKAKRAKRASDPSSISQFSFDLPREENGTTSAGVASSPSQRSVRSSVEQQPKPPRDRDSGVLPEMYRRELVGESTRNGTGLVPVQRPRSSG